MVIAMKKLDLFVCMCVCVGGVQFGKFLSASLVLSSITLRLLEMNVWRHILSYHAIYMKFK